MNLDPEASVNEQHKCVYLAWYPSRVLNNIQSKYWNSLLTNLTFPRRMECTHYRCTGTQAVWANQRFLYHHVPISIVHTQRLLRMQSRPDTATHTQWRDSNPGPWILSPLCQPLSLVIPYKKFSSMLILLSYMEWVCISLLLLRLPKMFNQCCSNVPGNLYNLGGNKDVQPDWTIPIPYLAEHLHTFFSSGHFTSWSINLIPISYSYVRVTKSKHWLCMSVFSTERKYLLSEFIWIEGFVDCIQPFCKASNQNCNFFDTLYSLTSKPWVCLFSGLNLWDNFIHILTKTEVKV